MKNLKHSIALFFLLTFSLYSAAQHSTKYGFELREYLKTASAHEKIPLLVEGDEHQIIQLTNQLGEEIRLQFESLFSLEIPAQYINVFAESSAVQNIEFSTTPDRTHTDTMLVHTNVDSIIQQAAPLRQAYTGKGVLLGVIDSGIELAHPDFQDSTGKTRALYVWDQTQAFNPAQQALHYNYGIEWDSAAINARISTDDDKANEFGHGSDVTGAAASNGFANGFYQWYYNNSRILGRINSTMLVQSSGNYFCSFTDNNGCSVNSDTVNVIVTNLNEIVLQTLSIYPNPSNGMIVVSTKNDICIERIDLFDVNGNLVWSKKIQQTGQQFNLTLSLITKGIYFLRAHSPNETIQKKLLIE